MNPKGLKYQASNKQHHNEPSLFSEHQMEGGVSKNFFDVYADSYRVARERFMLEANKEEYVCTDWVISIA